MASHTETTHIEAILARSSPPDSALVQVLKAVFNQRWIGQQRFTATSELDALHDALLLSPNAHVLEIGSGIGGPAIYLARQAGCHVTGIDASPANVWLARDSATAAGVADCVRFVVGDVSISHVPAKAFDAIVSHDIFITIANPACLFATCHRVLQPGGRMASTLIVKAGALTAPPRQPTEVAWPIPTADDYRAYAEQAGLCVLALDDRTRLFRAVCARWRGALVVWDLALLPHVPPEAFVLSPTTIAQVAEWASQGVIGQVRMVLERERSSM
jgi:SAM-dependent methyltransferase